MDMENCTICPRRCGADRLLGKGRCGCSCRMHVAYSMLHHYEEPIISGNAGSGAVFFSGCSLGCIYCQNKAISRSEQGQAYSPEALAELMLSLERQGAHNINLVSAAHYLPDLLTALALVRAQLSVPIIYNTSGYETQAAIRMLGGLVDVYLPDLKYFGAELSTRYSFAPDYNAVAVAAIDEMVRQQSEIKIENGLIKQGVIIRHLVLPGQREDSKAVMAQIASRWKERVLISLMRQYSPEFAPPECGLNRKVTAFEYNDVLKAAVALGLDGFSQGEESIGGKFTPNFLAF